MGVSILIGDVRDRLKELADESVHCCVTSPPYFGLRDYGVAGQIGLEPTPDEFIAELVGVFKEVRRVLRNDGTLFLNLGDSYTGSASTGGAGKETAYTGQRDLPIKRGSGLKPKDLIGIPWRVAFALQADGWWLRQDIIWSKPNPMPESVTDRCTKAHEYLFMLTKSARYYFDAVAIAERAGTAGQTRTTVDHGGGGYQAAAAGKKPSGNQIPGTIVTRAEMRNKRSVWEVATQPFSEAHFATFPPALIEPCVLAGCPANCCSKCWAPWVREVERDPVEQAGLTPKAEQYREQGLASSKSTIGRKKAWGPDEGRKTTLGFSPSCQCNAEPTPGTVLDPFGGAGTTGLVADRLQRNAILIELNPEYAAIAQRRINSEMGMFGSVDVRAA